VIYNVLLQNTAAIISTGSPFPHFETGWLNTGQDGNVLILTGNSLSCEYGHADKDLLV
jgi:hypothetical protein